MDVNVFVWYFVNIVCSVGEKTALFFSCFNQQSGKSPRAVLYVGKANPLTQAKVSEMQEKAVALG